MDSFLYFVSGYYYLGLRTWNPHSFPEFLVASSVDYNNMLNDRYKQGVVYTPPYQGAKYKIPYPCKLTYVILSMYMDLIRHLISL